MFFQNWHHQILNPICRTVFEILTFLFVKILLGHPVFVQNLKSRKSSEFLMMGNIKYNGVNIQIPVDTSDTAVSQRCLKTLRDIQYGAVDHPWAVDIASPDILQLSQLEKERLADYTKSIQQHLHF